MGITGLLPLLHKASKNSHVRNFSGYTAAIDAYCWLHKGAFGCAEKLGKGEPTDAYITYCMKYIQILLDNKIKPILVLDGRNLPSKEHTEKKRRQKREENRKLARKYLQEGNRKGAWECFTKCVDITPEMARQFIKRLRSMKIDYVVAPYEADAQLAYLAKTGIADIIITEDSDLILFGCPKIFFKMSLNGDGKLFDQSKLPQCLGLTPKQFNFDRFRWMCILSGCDYLQNLQGLGLGRAKKVFLATEHSDIEKMLRSIPSLVEQISEVPEEYIAGFIQAENTFLYQLAFDTKTRLVVPLHPYADSINPNDLPFAGKYEDKKLALGLALGNVDLHSLNTVDDFEPMKFGYNTSTSIWSSSFKVEARVNPINKSTMVAMQFSAPSKKTSSLSNKKRPFAVTNADDEKVPGDNELLAMYSQNSVTHERKPSLDSLESDTDEVDIFVKTEIDSPAASKRRRITKFTKTEENPSSPSRVTRSSSNLPFIKSPLSDARVHVKSKYFRDEMPKFTVSVKISDEDKIQAELMLQKLGPDNGLVKIKNEEEAFLSQPLSIYSYRNSSQDTDYADVTASSQLSNYSDTTKENSQMSLKLELSGESDGSPETDDADSGVCNFTPETRSSIRLRNKNTKTDDIPTEITLDDDEDDEAYESMGVVNGITKSLRSSSISKTAITDSRYSTSPYFANANSSSSTGSSKTVRVAGRSCRRQGLSKTTNTKSADPKQRSVKDMFAKQSRM